MIVDTSAVMAVIEGEDGSADVEHALAEASTASISTATAVELTSVLMRYARVEVHREVDRLLDAWGIQLAPFDAAQARIAQQAYRDYGRGSGHPARLNLGDCFSYALATVSGEPLLFVGDDFTRTDIPAVLPSR
jgi:ribonuclease VapC